MDSREPIEDHELAACPRCHEQPTWGRIHYYDEDGNARHDDAIRCLHCHYWFYVGSDKAETMARWNRRPSPVAESTPTDATAVEAEREACAEVVRAAIELGLQAGRLSNALDGQEDYRLQRQTVLNAMKDLSTALDARTPKES